MKRRYKLLIGALVCIALPAALFASYGASKRHRLQNVRRQLHAEGFKIDLAEVQIRFSSEAIARSDAVARADIGLSSTLQSNICAPVYEAAMALVMHTSNSVVVPWREEFFAGLKRRSPWPAVYQTLEKHRRELDGAIAAALDGPLGFQMCPITGPMYEQKEKIVAAAKALGVNVLCELYYERRADAYTNLLALTRLVSRWEKSPDSVCDRFRTELAYTAYVATWHALQAHCWTEQQLTALETEWTQAEFLASLPERVGLERVGYGLQCDSIRHGSNEKLTLDDILKNPKDIPSELKNRVLLAWYRWAGSFDDEKNLLLFFRDRELDMRRVIRAPNIASMLPLPGVTNTLYYMSPYAGSVGVSTDNSLCHLQNGGYLGPLGHAVRAEIHRRIALTALALERHRIRTGAYPEKLDDLTDVAPDARIDFADGQVLRYHRTDGGHFFLYSIGLDITDNHGDAVGPFAQVMKRPVRLGVFPQTDIIWPLPAELPKPQPPHDPES